MPRGEHQRDLFAEPENGWASLRALMWRLPDLTDCTKNDAKNVKDFLETLAAKNAKGGEFRITVREIAKSWITWSPRKITDVVKLCRELGLLIDLPTWSPLGRGANTYRIVWANVCVYARGENIPDLDAWIESVNKQREEALKKASGNPNATLRPTPKGPPEESEGICKVCEGLCKVCEGLCKVCEGLCKVCRTYKEDSPPISPPIKTSPFPPPDPLPMAESDPMPTRKEEDSILWKRAKEGLRRCKVRGWWVAIKEARERVVPPAEILGLIAHFEAHPGAWEPNGLFVRVMSQSAGDDVSNGWPDPAPAYLAKAEAAQFAERARRKAEREAREAAELRRQREADERRAAECDAALDRLSPDEIDRLARESLGKNPFLDRLYRIHGIDSTIVREFLFESLQRIA